MNSRRRVPVMDEVKVTRLINGPEAFTPDNEFCLGETDVRGFFVAAGFCAHGLAGAGGIGKLMAEWIDRRRAVDGPLADGHPALRPHYRSPAYTLKRAKEVYETYYDIRYPGHERLAGRPLRVSSATNGIASTEPRSARSPAGSASTGTSPTPPRATRRCARTVGRAATGRRRSAPSTGPRARRRACSTSPPSPSSRCRAPVPRTCWSDCATTASRAGSAQITYTQMWNRHGGIECDFTSRAC